jgi:predicted acylesterase/phospholipase RssA
MLAAAMSGCASRPEGPPPGLDVPLPWGAVDPRAAEPVGGGSDDALLTLAGSGSLIAYGAGVLCGWTEAGTRPEFQTVAASSTSAIIATYAFLGPEYDSQLQDFVTGINTLDVYRQLGLISSMTTGAVNGSGPLHDLIEQIVDEDLLDEVASQYARGRRLYIGTMNVDNGTEVIWDMGAIASSQRPDRLDRYRDVVVASTSLPTIMPPVYIPVEVDVQAADNTADATPASEPQMKKYWQMHVDGAMREPVLVSRFMLRGSAGGRLYVLLSVDVHGRAAFPTPVRPSVRELSWAVLSSIASRGLIHGLYRAKVLANLEQVEFRVTAIPPGLDDVPRMQIFDPDNMQNLFQVGFEHATDGSPWRSIPAGASVEEVLESTP